MRVLEDEEELAAIRPWPSIGHGQSAARVGGSGEILICVDVTRSTLASRARCVTTLEGGKSWGVQEAVTRGAIVIILAREKGEGVDRARRSRVELNDDGPSVGDHGRGPRPRCGLGRRKTSELLYATGGACVSAIDARDRGGGCAARGERCC